MLNRIAAGFVAVLLAAAFELPSATAEETAIRRDMKPVVRVWYPETLAADHQRFLDELSKPAQEEPPSSGTSPTDPPVEPTKPGRAGVLVYFDPLRYLAGDSAESPQPSSFSDSIVSVRFRKIASREEFEKLVRKETGLESNPSLGKLQAREDGFEYNSQLRWAKFYPQRWSAIPDMLTATSRYWRFHDGYVFHGNAPEILTMELPDAKDLKPSSRDAKRDIFAQADFDSLLPRYRKPLWEMIRLRLESELQQRDDEPVTEFALRRAAGEFYLNLLQALANDVQTVQVGVDFADERNPAAVDLEVTARPGSDLEAYLGSGRRPNARLGSLIEQPALLTLATSWGMPERADRTVAALVEYFRERLTARVGLNFEAVFAFDDFAEAVRKSLAGKSDVVLKMARSDEGFTLFGGIQLDEATAAAAGLERLLNGLTIENGGGISRSTDRGGRRVLSFRPDELPHMTLDRGRDHLPAEAHMTVTGTVLWFSFGGSDSLDVLHRAIDETERPGAPAANGVAAALVDISLERWLTGEEEAAGFDRVPQLALEAGGRILQQLPGSSRTARGDVGLVAIAADADLTASVDAVAVGTELSPKVMKFTAKPAVEAEVELSVVDSLVTERLNLNSQFVLSMAFPDAVDDDLSRYFKDRQSRVRIELSGDKRSVQLKATAGLGVVEWFCSRLIHGGRRNGDYSVRYLLSTPSQSGSDASIRLWAPPKSDE